MVLCTYMRSHVGSSCFGSSYCSRMRASVKPSLLEEWSRLLVLIFHCTVALPADCLVPLPFCDRCCAQLGSAGNAFGPSAVSDLFADLRPEAVFSRLLGLGTPLAWVGIGEDGNSLKTSQWGQQVGTRNKTGCARHASSTIDGGEPSVTAAGKPRQHLHMPQSQKPWRIVCTSGSGLVRTG